MKFKVSVVSSLVALALGFQPGFALAAKKHGAAHAATASYPMKADEFRKLADTRIERMWAAIEKKLDHRSVSAERKKSLRKMFDEAAEETRSETAKAIADGVVTQAEGDKVKRLALGIRLKLRERLKAEKSSRATSKGREARKNGGPNHVPKKSGSEDPTKSGSKVPTHGDTKGDDESEGNASAERRSESARQR
jgi:hypothetical protein